MRKFASLFLVLFLAAPLFADTVTCQDGRVVGRTMFHAYISDAQLCGEEPIVTPGPPVLPEGFESIFGPRPVTSDYRGRLRDYQEAKVKWENALGTFKGLGMPADADAGKVANAEASAEFFEMGPPAYYEDNYGFQVRFPGSQDRSFQTSFTAFVGYGHASVVVSYQWGLTVDGILIPPDKIHPFAPPKLTKAQMDLRDEAE